jgi:nitrate/TMAO reductase-like tetraheme cytochrome c subunit
MDIIELKAPKQVQAKRSDVNFPHGRHFVIDCKSCHHKWEGQGQIKSCTTSGCHDGIKSSTEDPSAKKYSYYKKTFHEKCIGCHKLMKIENRKLEMQYTALKNKLPATGPTGCIECHPKDR